MKIVELNEALLPCMHRPNQPFPIIGKLVPALKDGHWSYSEELLPQPGQKTYPCDDSDYSEYIASQSRAVFLAFSGEEYAGRIILSEDWNQYALIEDISVDAPLRGTGIGTALIRRAVQWAEERRLKGLAVETQDNNLLACRFYAKCGFQIGAVNTMLYANFEKPYSDETAVFWYLKF